MLCLVCLHLAAWAEVVTGTIRDAETGEVLVDATVLEEASQKGSEFGNKSKALTGRRGERLLVSGYSLQHHRPTTTKSSR